MPLIKALPEIKEVLPKLVSSISANTLLPNFQRTEYKYIVPIIGPTLYASLVTAYEGNTLDADQLVLVKHLRLIIAAYAYKDELGLSVLTIGDGGAKKVSQGATEPVRGWEVQRLENTLIDAAMDGTEIVLNYLFDNAATYTEWTDSEQYSKIKSLLIKTATDFNDKCTLFRPQRSYFLMKAVLYDVQRLFIEETIGKDLLVYLRDKVTPTDKEVICIDLLKKSLAFYTLMKAAKQFSVAFTDGGFTILGEKSNNSMENGLNQPIDMELLRMKIDECDTEGGSYLELARNTLVALYTDGTVTNDYITAFDTGPLASYVQPVDRTSGNENRKIYAMP